MSTASSQHGRLTLQVFEWRCPGDPEVADPNAWRSVVRVFYFSPACSARMVAIVRIFGPLK